MTAGISGSEQMMLERNRFGFNGTVYKMPKEFCIDITMPPFCREVKRLFLATIKTWRGSQIIGVAGRNREHKLGLLPIWSEF
jgi:hypothetical protein